MVAESTNAFKLLINDDYCNFETVF